ncbi:MAG: cytochrome c family protein [Alphaproteobacteria bacterium]|nr:MAG: cytochrome c family protein [Alphaproteobacteria bacterium]
MVLAALLACFLQAAGDAARAEGDPARGRELFRVCAACHTIEAGAGTKVGPNLHGLFGRKAGTVEGFAYSPAMAASGILWNEETLGRYLASPRAMVPGNRMPYPGMPKAADRADLIAYLREATK